MIQSLRARLAQDDRALALTLGVVALAVYLGLIVGHRTPFDYFGRLADAIWQGRLWLDGAPLSELEAGPDGHFYIASVYNGVIAEFNADGTFVRDVLKPPAGEMLGEKPFSTGTPLGVGVAPDGSVYYADIGIVATSAGIGPGRGTGKVRRITFDASGNSKPPVTMDQALAFPDGIGIWQAPAS